ncbi:MAG: hypothetical protein LBF54_04320 [Holosporaceae bacterium]|jgi:F0F1-type ATP synthase membrane subunit b/b'|nr:hypothetical protein [Holosporaceae bacterium]
MLIDPNISIVVSFLGFVWIFAKKIYPQVTKTLDDHIESVKNKIYEAEILKDEASLSLKKAHGKKNDTAEIIRKNREASREKIRRLRLENEQYLKSLREKLETSMKIQLETELARQKDLLMEKLSEKIIEKLSEQLSSNDCEVSINFTKEDLQKLTK